MATRSARKQFVVCLRNDGYEASLERRKIYQVLPDPDAAKHKQLRIIDESGEDYLYPQKLFAPIELPQSIRRAVNLLPKGAKPQERSKWHRALAV